MVAYSISEQLLQVYRPPRTDNACLIQLGETQEVYVRILFCSTNMESHTNIFVKNIFPSTGEAQMKRHAIVLLLIEQLNVN